MKRLRASRARFVCSSRRTKSTNGLLVSAYKDVKKECVVYVFTNLSEQERQVNIGAQKRVKTYTTDKQENLGLSLQSLSSVRIPERSVVTVVN